MDWKRLLESASESVNDDLRLRNNYLIAENRILRNQIHGRVQLMDSERKELAEIGAKRGKKALEKIATIAKPVTILAWNRKFVNDKVDTSESPKAIGRPRVDPEIENLVIRIARENRAWGYDRIQGAFMHLGYAISDQTVGNILKRHRIPPAPERKKTVTWRAFIRCHLDVLLATDFFNHEIWRWMSWTLACLISLIDLGRHEMSLTRMTWRQYIQPIRSLTRLSCHLRVYRSRGDGYQDTKLLSPPQKTRFSKKVTGRVETFVLDQAHKARSPDLCQVICLSRAQSRQRQNSPPPPQSRLGLSQSHIGRKAA